MRERVHSCSRFLACSRFSMSIYRKDVSKVWQVTLSSFRHRSSANIFRTTHWKATNFYKPSLMLSACIIIIPVKLNV